MTCGCRAGPTLTLLAKSAGTLRSAVSFKTSLGACCLAAYVLQVARNSKELATPRAGGPDFARLLQDWVDGGGRPLSVRAGARRAGWRGLWQGSGGWESKNKWEGNWAVWLLGLTLFAAGH